MKATADHWININGKWYAPGEEYEIDVTPAGDDTPDEPSGGGELPAVTADDNGDVLTVVEGSWAKAAPSGGGGGAPFIVEWDYNGSGNYTVQTCQDTWDALVAGRPVYFKGMNDDESYTILSYVTRYASDEVTNWSAQFGGSSFTGSVDGYWQYAD